MQSHDASDSNILKKNPNISDIMAITIDIWLKYAVNEIPMCFSCIQN